MNIDFDRLRYSLTGEYEEVMLEKQIEEKDKEIERLNNIINGLKENNKKLQLKFIDKNKRIKKIKRLVKEKTYFDYDINNEVIAGTDLKELEKILNEK